MRLSILKHAFGADFLSTIRATLVELRARTDPAAAWHCYSMLVQSIDVAHKSMRDMLNRQAMRDMPDNQSMVDTQATAQAALDDTDDDPFNNLAQEDFLVLHRDTAVTAPDTSTSDRHRPGPGPPGIGPESAARTPQARPATAAMRAPTNLAGRPGNRPASASASVRSATPPGDARGGGAEEVIRVLVDHKRLQHAHPAQRSAQKPPAPTQRSTVGGLQPRASQRGGGGEGPERADAGIKLPTLPLAQSGLVQQSALAGEAYIRSKFFVPDAGGGGSAGGWVGGVGMQSPRPPLAKKPRPMSARDGVSASGKGAGPGRGGRVVATAANTRLATAR